MAGFQDDAAQAPTTTVKETEATEVITKTEETTPEQPATEVAATTEETEVPIEGVETEEAKPPEMTEEKPEQEEAVVEEEEKKAYEEENKPAEAADEA